MLSMLKEPTLLWHARSDSFMVYRFESGFFYVCIGHQLVLSNGNLSTFKIRVGMMLGRAISGFHSLDRADVGIAMLGELVDQGGVLFMELLNLRFQ